MFNWLFKSEKENRDIPEKRGFTYNPPPPNLSPPQPPAVIPKRPAR